MRTTLWTTLALICFAANSILCRMALGRGLLDAASFTSVRLVSGALTLALLLAFLKPEGKPAPRSGWAAPFSLFAYAACFSFAYLRLTAGTGALLLFGAVQATMLGWGLFKGERAGPREWAGWILASCGLGILALPGWSAPNPLGALLMAIAGIAWGAYSLLGRGTQSPIARTGSNFLRSLPFTLGLSFVFLRNIHGTPEGLALAIASGALASGVGYSFWYAALPHLTAFRAGILQLLPPALAAWGGVVLLGEGIGWRLVAAGSSIALGVLLAISKRDK